MSMSTTMPPAMMTRVSSPESCGGAQGNAPVGEPAVSLKDGVLHVRGTAGADNISVTQDPKSGMITVSNGGQVLGEFPADEVKAVRVRGGRGADNIKVDVGNDIKVGVRGGRGNDNIEVDGGKDVFVRGGRGADTLKAVGVTGAHIMGGRGKDDINVTGDDNTIGGVLGDNQISVDGQGNTILTQNGNDTIIAPGDNQQKVVNARDLCAQMMGQTMLRG